MTNWYQIADRIQEKDAMSSPPTLGTGGHGDMESSESAPLVKSMDTKSQHYGS
eukprot:CAMPEP_0113602910 /NCGR_PEP_ID=MMETSP0017_2-20120614/1001_1 /TAXON_ID=2856 /ORGANISM="Cylindrotheca closterium" /LENGTH=52 /DNA_ID=CAMNT_0000511275 /DNA_START=75 /DNA_END=229 /DNA_ORIENTATION=- /assembly_acc=CAM_ASM_000147